MSAPEWLIIAPVAAVAIMAITFVMSLILQTTNRLVIGRLLGWGNYRAMQKELSDLRKEQMAAARSNDPKQLEKVKKKQSQMTALNAKMMKPQMIQMAISFCFIPLFLFVRHFFDTAEINGVLGVVLIPGLSSPISYLIWYFIASLFTSALVMRLLGTTPT
jgi:uncharacterized membrane protein (DUF106 family)